MTVLTVAIMLTAFVFPRTLVVEHDQFAVEAKNDRILMLPTQGWTAVLPGRYTDDVRSMDGVAQATGVRWAGFKLPGKDEVFFASNAVDAAAFLAIHREISAPEAEKQAFVADERSVLVSRDLARERGWKLGDRVIFQSHDAPGQWEVTVACVYDAVGGGWAKRSLWAHYGFFNRGLPPEKRDQLQFIVAQVSEPSRAAAVARALDVFFDAESMPTLSMEDQVFAAANIARIGALLGALDLVSILILFVVTAILFNTLSLGVRERTREFGVLRAIGFGPSQLCALVLAEAALLGLGGALLGLGLSYLLLEGLVGPFLQENLQFQELRVPPAVAVMGFGAGIGLALAAAIIPALRVGRLEVRDALGRIA
jgi:putative ABC transport system permease protein